MRFNFLSLSNLTLLVALSLSSVAAYYSIIGLTAIFAGAVIPIIVMGGILEIGKITATVWLRKYWHRASLVLKLYLVPAVVLLALLTSMGIFGFLSRAHSDQGLASGESQAKIAIIDEKIKTQRENIELARKALQQLDAQVDARLSRGDSEAGAERAVQIRRQQQGERSKLQKEIVDAQKEIQKLNEERAPLAAENRKLEAEVGPIKYIAAFIYGDNPDANLLERAVRWVIILLVVVFDPLAIALVLAANASKEWDKEEPKYEKDNGPLTDNQIEQIKESVEEPKTTVWPFPDPIIKDSIFPKPMKFVDPGEHPKDSFEKEEAESEKVEKPILEQHPYLQKAFDHFKGLKPMVAMDEIKKVVKKKATKKPKKVVEEIVKTEPEKEIPSVERPGDYLLTADSDSNIMQVKQELPYKESPGGYIEYQGKHMSKDAFFGMHPEFLKVSVDAAKPVNSSFGTSFPNTANKGDIFTRVDVLPNKVFKYDGSTWIEINKDSSSTYLFNTKYLDYLIEKIDQGQYDPELLNDNERAQIEDYLKIQKINSKK